MIVITEKELRKIISNLVLKEAKVSGGGFTRMFLDSVGAISSFFQNIGGSENIKGNITKGIDVKKGVHGSSKNWGSTNEQKTKSQAAWNYLRPFLPKGAVLTSVFRTQESQDNIIRKYAKKKGYAGPDDIDKMWSFTKSKGLVIARNVGRGHGGASGTCAFDISGANLEDIYESVVFVSDHPELSKFAKFAKQGLGRGKSSIIERKNNAVHVHFNLSDIKTPYNPNFADNVVKEAESEKSSDESNKKGYTIDYTGDYKIGDDIFYKLIYKKLPHGKKIGYFIKSGTNGKDIYKRSKPGKAKIGDTIVKSTDVKIHPKLVEKAKAAFNKKKKN